MQEVGNVGRRIGEFPPSTSDLMRLNWKVFGVEEPKHEPEPEPSEPA